MKFGLIPAYGNAPVADPEYVLGLAELAEELGFESIWAVEHPAVPAAYASRYPYARSGKMPIEEVDIPDPLAWLAYVAAATQRLRLATGVLVLPLHNPVLLAKQLATIDRLSGGRVLLGIGVGWLAEEFAAVGVPFERRGDRAAEYVAALRSLWRDDLAGHDGEFVSFGDIRSRPKPVDPAGIPIHVGGHSPAAARRAGCIGDGFFPLGGKPEALGALLDEMRVAAIDAGRDPSEVEVTLAGAMDLDWCRRAADVGAVRFVVSAPTGDLEVLRRELGTFSDTVMATLG